VLWILSRGEIQFMPSFAVVARGPSELDGVCRYLGLIVNFRLRAVKRMSRTMSKVISGGIQKAKWARGWGVGSGELGVGAQGKPRLYEGCGAAHGERCSGMFAAIPLFQMVGSECKMGE
jgi:hypothetical protein